MEHFSFCCSFCSYLFGWLKYILFDTFMATYYRIIKGSFIVDTIYTYCEYREAGAGVR